MQELTLNISERAQSRLADMGKEFEIVEGQLGAAREAPRLAMVRIGAPLEADRERFTALEQGGLTIWAPDELTFAGNEVVIDLYGISGMVLPLALSALVEQPSAGGCAGCHGDCAHCH